MNVLDEVRENRAGAPSAPISRHIDWYSEGETRIVRVDGVEVRIRFVGRKGRRGRILVEAPAGAVFEACVAPSYLQNS